MREGSAGAGFSWYTETSSGACPPRSLFVSLLALGLGLTLPAVALWYLEHYPALRWLGVAGLILLLGLTVDILVTHRRYRRWAAQSVCADCGGCFPGLQQAAPANCVQTY